MTEFDVGLVEGGEFTCYEHSFKATTKQEWDDHRSTTGHKETGVTPCVYCGLPTIGSFDIMPDLRLNAVCQECGVQHEVEPSGRRR